ncbi:MAG: HXXEE domain-containing protein, partial [Deltaproteobacteria bacterium]|nr:HXXEE domain-containing protein [Deltaproteobacteria bacterium]
MTRREAERQYHSVYWLPVLAFAAHIAEEYPRFPEWATRHFGATSRAWYVYSHVPLVFFVIAIAAFAEKAPPQSVWPLLATAIQWVLATNAIFHLVTTRLFREYSPGVVTGTLLFLPTTAYVFWRTLDASLLTPT